MKLDAESIAKALGKFTTKPGGGLMACCPAHDDDNPSLSIDDADNGGVLVKCWAGCSQDAIISALKERDLWPAKEKKEPAPKVKQKRVAGYHFCNPTGKELYRKLRKEPGRGDRAKEYTFMYTDPTTGKEEFGHGKHNQHVLYNLPNVTKAKSVIVVEGEGLVDLLAEWGLVGT